MEPPLYLDHAATTPLDPRVADAMQPFFRAQFANPSSLHAPGREARQAVEQARRHVAELIHALPEEIIFTASGTESDNFALRGPLESQNLQNTHIIISAIEHPAILQTCRYLQNQGVEVTQLPVDQYGLVHPESLESAFRPNTRLVSIMAANNVVGTIQPIHELAQITHKHQALFHTDAVQAAGKIPLDVTTHPIDLISLSAHKLHGPKGVGALYVRKGTPIAPLIHGGGQEFGLRSATENVPGIVGFGCAAAIAWAEGPEDTTRLVGWRDRMIDGILARFPNAYLIGHPYRRLPGHVCVGFAGLEGEAIKMLLALDQAGIAVSTGSACSANHAHEPSYILLAMGFDPVRARGSLRITMGRFNTAGDVERMLEALAKILPSTR